MQMDKGLRLDWNPSRSWDSPPRSANLSRFGVDSPTLHDLQMDKGLSPPGPCPKIDKSMTGPFTTCKWTRVQRKPYIVFGQALGPPNHRTLEHISQGTGSVSTDRNINDKSFVPQCTLEQGFEAKGRKIHDRALRPRTYPSANLKLCLDKHWGLQTIERLSIFLRGPGASPQIETSMTSPSSQNVR